MDNTIFIKRYMPDEIKPVDEKEVFRYSGCGNGFDIADEALKAALTEAIKEATPLLSYGVCYRVLDAIPDFMKPSDNLMNLLGGCNQIIVFAATVGIGIDRLINKYGCISPSKALLLQGFGAERIESLCDSFCDEFANKTARFSPGYGDVALSMQEDFFKLLAPEKRIGLTLNESMLMSPSKSVTAVFGIDEGLSCNDESKNKCDSCNNHECEYRKRRYIDEDN